VRVLKGVAAYLANFTPPAAALAGQYATIGSANPLWQHAVLQLPFDGVDGATSTTDVSPAANTITFNGNAQLDTAQKKFGVSSLLLDGNGDYLSLASDADFAFGTYDHQVECFFRTAAISATTQVICAWGGGSWHLSITDTDGTNAQIVFTSTSGAVITRTVTWASLVNTWNHVALVKRAGVYYLYVNGVLANDWTNADSLGNSVFRIGTANTTTLWFNGHIDSLRVIKGATTYFGSAFVVPLVDYPQATL
jgi:hypothetical protein